MKVRHFLLLASIATLLPACDRKPQTDAEEVVRKAREEVEAVKAQVAELQDRERQRQQQVAADQLAAESQRLADERGKLERDRANLDETQRRAADARIAQIRDEQRAAEKREEQRKAEQRKVEQRIAAERTEAARTAQQQAKTEQTLDFFYDALDPQGDWVELDRYGYCWQPTLAKNPGWRPYVDGHWVYTNYGWTWVSQEPFGWATYHYGRWTRVRGLGWVWVPGSEWAPAWVAWRSSDRYVGWAPLPPEAHSGTGFNAGVDSYYDIGPGSYNFVEVETMGAPTYVGRVVEPAQNLTVINQTVNVTNTTYQRVDNRTVLFNTGPQFAAIERQSKVRRMELERVQTGRPAVAEERGGVLQLLAPFIAAAAKPAGQPAKVRERVRAPELERGWTGDDAATVTRIREQQQQEARRAEQAERKPQRLPSAAKAEPVRPPAAIPVAVPAATPRPPLPPKRPTTPVAEAAPDRPPKATPMPPAEASALPPAEEKPVPTPRKATPAARPPSAPEPVERPAATPRLPKAPPLRQPLLPPRPAPQPGTPAENETARPPEPRVPAAVAPGVPAAEPAELPPERPAKGKPQRPGASVPGEVLPPGEGAANRPEPATTPPALPAATAVNPAREGLPKAPAAKPPRALPKGKPITTPEPAAR